HMVYLGGTLDLSGANDPLWCAADPLLSRISFSVPQPSWFHHGDRRFSFSPLDFATTISWIGTAHDRLQSGQHFRQSVAILLANHHSTFPSAGHSGSLCRRNLLARFLLRYLINENFDRFPSG